MPDETTAKPGSETARHRALGEPARARVLESLRAAGAPLDAGALAARLGLHVSTIRWHLRVLAAAGLVTREREERLRPGRPRAVYRPGPAALGEAGAPALLRPVSGELGASHAAAPFLERRVDR